MNHSEALRIAWKKRKDYLGPDKKTSLYSTWRARVFTKKGKIAGFPAQWLSFKGFKSNIPEGWEEGKILVRKDINKSFSKDNCEWINKKDQGYTKLSILEYRGESKTLLEWCDSLDLNYNGVRQRYFKGKNLTVEQILYGKMTLTPKEIRDIKLIESDQKKRNKISRMFSAYKLKDKKRNLEFNLTKEYFINNIISKPCIYCGSTENIGCDRLDNKKGHTEDNIVPACYICNTVRNDHFSFEEMKILGNVIKNIIENRNL